MSISFTPLDGTNSSALETALSSLLSGGLTLVSGSASFVGGVGQTSVFSGGEALGLTTGLLLTSGSGTPAASNTSNGYSVTTNSGTDSDLAAAGQTLTGFSTANDANVVSFEFNVSDPAITKATITFVFGSDEYPEYADKYSDVGAILVNGVNIAKFANGQPLGVTTDNLSYYQNNTDGHIAIEYDGVSYVLTTTVAVHQGFNSIKIGVADANDTALDSGLFVSSIVGLGGSTDGGGSTITQPPVAKDDIASTTANHAVQINVLQNDVDPDGTIAAFVVSTNPEHGTASFDANGVLTYTPDAGYSGADELKYTITDNSGATATAEVQITVKPSVTPPPSTNGGPIIYGNTDSTPNDISSVADTKGKHNAQLSSGNSSGAAYTGFQKFYGGDGNDAFIMRAKDFAASNTPSKIIYDFHGAGGYSAVENDFVSFTGFGAGSTLNFVKTQNVGASGDTLDLYSIHSTATGLDYLIQIHSLDGKHLVSGDFAFYV